MILKVNYIDTGDLIVNFQIYILANRKTHSFNISTNLITNVRMIAYK